jgi:hypothetical protein
MPYRDDLTALAARHDALAAEVAGATRELDDARRLLEQARARAKLPVLDHLRIATPCTADWSQMTGDDRARHCGACRKTVYNLSGMTRDEAEALLIEQNGELCARYYQRPDGTILLADCEVGRQRRTARRHLLAAGAVVLLAGAGAAMLASRMDAPPDRDEPVLQGPLRATMGKIDTYRPPTGEAPGGPIEWR